MDAMRALDPRWQAILGLLDHAFQPIIRASDGSAYGFEALLRGYDAAGFASPSMISVLGSRDSSSSTVRNPTLSK